MTARTRPTGSPRVLRRLRVQGNATPTIKICILVISVITALIIVWTGVALNHSDKDVSKSDTSTRSLTGKSVTQDRKDATAAVTELLNLAGKTPNKMTAQQRLTRLDSQDYSVMDPGVASRVHLPDNAPAELRAQSYQALVTMDALLVARTKSATITPLAADGYQRVFVDQNAGTAFVPLSIYAGSQAAFSFEMTYLDGRWQLAPYSLVDAVKLSAALSPNTSRTNSK